MHPGQLTGGNWKQAALFPNQERERERRLLPWVPNVCESYVGAFGFHHIHLKKIEFFPWKSRHSYDHHFPTFFSFFLVNLLHMRMNTNNKNILLVCWLGGGGFARIFRASCTLQMG